MALLYHDHESETPPSADLSPSPLPILVLQALFRDFLERELPRQKKRLNLWGVVPHYDPFWRGNLEEVLRLLEALGLEVNSFFLAEDSIDAIRQAGSASLNVVISQAYGLAAARLFEELHGTPHFKRPLFARKSGLFLWCQSIRIGKVSKDFLCLRQFPSHPMRS